MVDGPSVIVPIHNISERHIGPCRSTHLGGKRTRHKGEIHDGTCHRTGYVRYYHIIRSSLIARWRGLHIRNPKRRISCPQDVYKMPPRICEGATFIKHPHGKHDLLSRTNDLAHWLTRNARTATGLPH